MQRQETHDADRLEDSATQNPSQEHIEQDFNIPMPPPLPEQNVNPGRPVLRIVNKVNSRTYKRVAATPNHCLFSNCNNNERLLVPSIVKELLIQRYKIYVPLSARICNFHLNNNLWDELLASYSDFTGHQMNGMMALMQRAVERKVDFTDFNNLDSKMCHFWLGFTAEQLQTLLSMSPSLFGQVPSACLALSIYLAKIRTGDSNERLSQFFNLPRSTL